MTPQKLKSMAKKHGWDFIDHQEDIGMMSFRKVFQGHPARINIYTTKMTVATCINHPVQGKTQLFRRRVNDQMMKKIFENPRIHTDRGYKTRRNKI